MIIVIFIYSEWQQIVVTSNWWVLVSGVETQKLTRKSNGMNCHNYVGDKRCSNDLITSTENSGFTLISWLWIFAFQNQYLSYHCIFLPTSSFSWPLHAVACMTISDYSNLVWLVCHCPDRPPVCPHHPTSMNEVGFLLFENSIFYETIITVLHFQTKTKTKYQKNKNKISKEKVVLIFEQRTQLSFIFFSGDYILIVYITAHSYVTTCDLCKWSVNVQYWTSKFGQTLNSDSRTKVIKCVDKKSN